MPMVSGRQQPALRFQYSHARSRAGGNGTILLVAGSMNDDASIVHEDVDAVVSRLRLVEQGPRLRRKRWPLAR